MFGWRWETQSCSRGMNEWMNEWRRRWRFFFFKPSRGRPCMLCTCSLCGSEATGSFLLCHDFGRWPPAYWHLDVGQAKVHTLSSLALSLSLAFSCIYILPRPLSSLPPSLSRVARQAAASPRLGINNSAGDRLLPSRCRNILFPRWLAGCVPGQGGGGGGGGGWSGPQKRGCSDY